MTTPHQTLKLAFALVLFLSSVLVCFLLQGICFILVRPVSKTSYQKVISYPFFCTLLNLPFYLEKWSNIKIVAHGAMPDPSESTLFTMNHISNFDWISFAAFSARYGFPLPGSFKAIAKAELGRIPLIGWCLRLADFVFLERSWKSDHLRLTQKFIDLSQYINDVFPLWLLIFPEGTRQTPEKLKASQDWCENQRKYIFSNLLYPRFRGFQGLVPIMRHSLDAIIDTTIIFEDNKAPSIMEVATGEAQATIRFHFRRFPISELPEESNELRKWLLDRWMEKEKIIEDYARDKNSLGPEFHTKISNSSWTIFIGSQLIGMFLILLLIYLSSKVKYGLVVVLTTVILLSIGSLLISRRVLKNSKQGMAAPKTAIYDSISK